MMSIHQYILFSLLLLAVAQASSEFLKLKVDPNSTLEEVNKWLEATRKEFRKDNLNTELVEINNHALAMLFLSEYPLEHYLLSKVDEAIREKRYAFLKSLHPVTTMIWWKDSDDLALLLMKAAGQDEWMSEKRWAKYAHFADWSLRFRDLIRLKNEHVYKNERLIYSIFKNEIFMDNFQEIIQEAYGSENFAFLSTIPYPSEEYPLDEDKAVFFWSLAYGQEWCPDEWSDYIGTVKSINETLKSLDIFQIANYNVFKHEIVRAFLELKGIKESLETAIKYDSLSFAQYLKEKCGPENFGDMAKACLKIHTFGEKPAFYHQATHHKYDVETLSQVYNLLLKSGRKLDVKSIKFRDVPILNEEYLQPLLDQSFDKTPLSTSELYSLGKTKTGIEFLKKISRREYMVNEKPFKLRWEGLSLIDTEAFKLIDKKLVSVNASGLKKFRKKCVGGAISKGDVKFLIDTAIPIEVEDAFTEASKGSLAVLDWIFENKPDLLKEFTWNDSEYRCSPSYVPLLKYLFKKSPLHKYLAEYTNHHLLQATRGKGDKDHFDEVTGIEGVEAAMKEYKFKIPDFPKGEKAKDNQTNDPKAKGKRGRPLPRKMTKTRSRVRRPGY